MYFHQGPVLSVCWNKVGSLWYASRIRIWSLNLRMQDGNKVFSGGTDNVGLVFDIATGQATQVAQHDAPIKTVKWVDAPHAGLLATGSWDSTIKVCCIWLSR